ncbi:hypothetical protein EMIHUDRAFT_258228, partial [Emiliania huxleyi CCMP1516]|uniref:Uncharacterized protein n=2 Tax=Emiliania huxleyi TaxID=2903 RepID=A0A0D3IB58_EMIH1
MAGSSGGSGGAGAPPAKLEQLPAFKEVRDASERRALFLKKLQLCSWPMDFTNGQIDARDKEIKRQTLLELMDYINSTKGAFSERTYPDVVHMIAANLFR